MTSVALILSAVRIDFAGEGRTDAEIARRLILAAGGEPGKNYNDRPQPPGKNALQRRLNGYNIGAAYGTAILVLRDLDHDAPCAGSLVAGLMPQRNPACLLRIAVRSAEAWLLADHEGLASAARLRVGLMPHNPEELENPKQELLRLLRQTSSRAIRSELDLGGAGPTNQMLGAWTSQFVRDAWSPERVMASGRACSLTRCMKRLREAIKRSA